MGMTADVGVLDVGTTNGSVAVTLPFRPKAVIFFGVPRTAVGSGNNLALTLGFAVENGNVPRASNTVHGVNGADPTESDTRQASNCFNLITTFLTDYWSGGVVTFSATGFSISMTKNGSATNNVKVCWLAIGGDCQVWSSTQTRRTSNGSQSITGCPFQPRGGLFFGGNAGASLNLSAAHAKMFIGMADAAGNQGVVSLCDENNAGTTDTYRVYKTTKLISLVGVTGTVHAEAGFTAWTSDGCTLDWTTTDANAYLYSFVFFDCETELEHLTNPTSGSAPVAETLGPYTTTPIAQLFAGCSTTNDGTVQNGAGIEIGASAQGKPGVCASTFSDDAAAAATNAHAYDDDKAIVHSSAAASLEVNKASATPQTDTSKESDLSWNPIDTASARRYMALTLGTRSGPVRSFAA